MDADERVRTYRNFPVSEARLHRQMLGIAQAICNAPNGAPDHLSWTVDQLSGPNCRALCEHEAAGRLDLYAIDEEPGAVFVSPRPGLCEWCAEAEADQDARAQSRESGGQTDTGTDNGEKSRTKKRRMTKAAWDCARIYKARKAKRPETTLAEVVEEYAAEHDGESEQGIYRRLTDHPEEWKTPSDEGR